MQTRSSIRGQIFFWLIIFAALWLNSQPVFSTPGGQNQAGLAINEFMAANRAGLADEDGQYADWIEIYNPGPRAVNLAGWSLTDDPNQPEKWTFPELSLASHKYLLVFASGKNRKPTGPGLELHTNFKLSQEGEFLGLYNILDSQFVDVPPLIVGNEFSGNEVSGGEFFGDEFPGNESPENKSPENESPENESPENESPGNKSPGNKSPGNESPENESPENESPENEFPKQFPDISYGRYPGRQNDSGAKLAYAYLATPTPGQPNDETLLWAGLTAPVNFNPARGFYNAPFSLELSTATPGAVIRYTIDGSPPTESHGEIYSRPITIKTTTLLRAAAFKPNFRPSPVDTHTYIFLDAVLAQPKAPPGFPKSWGGYQGELVKADYEMDPQIIDDPRYKDRLKQALESIPSLSLVTDRQSFHDLYANPRRRGRAWERPVSVELINPANGRPGFQINAGLRIQGESGRLEFMPKHPFRLFFRSEYGAARLKYPLFPASPVEEFDTLTLRSGVNRSYAGLPEFDQKWTAYTRDEWLRASQIAMSGAGSHGIFAHLYLNGLYWGLYNVVERPDASFMASYFGAAEDDWQAISHEEGLNSSSERFKSLHKLAAEGHLAEPEKYAALKSYLDISHFIDYLILNWYAGNIDWAFNNWYAGVQNSAGQVRYFVWDGERIWDYGAEIFFERDEYLNRPNLTGVLIEALLENPDFKMELADRLYQHLFNAGPLAEANSQARWLSLNNIIEPAIIGESARWGDVRQDPPLTQEDWFEARDDVLAQMEGNAAQLISLAREVGYYPEVDPPLFSRRGGQVPAGFKLAITLPSPAGGAIYYTTDDSDPRLQVTGQVAPGANIYQAPLTLTATTHIKARAFDGQTWSALNEAFFWLDEQPSSSLRITEIMYNPLGGDDYEFIELKNTGRPALNLANISFEGIAFTFPPLAPPLAPGELIVLVRNPTAFARRYPNVAIGGVYDGQLSNKGETISLKDAQGNVMMSLEYDDENGWPISPDGRGDSLVLLDPAQDPNKPESWRASDRLNGSPGVDEPGSW